MFLLINASPKIPSNPTANKYFHYLISPITKFMIEAMHPPKCQVPSIAISTLPLTAGGKNSSTAVKMAVNYPPTLTPVSSLPIRNKGKTEPIKQKMTPIP